MGHYEYYGIRSDYRKLAVVHLRVRQAWRFLQSSRSNTGSINWEDFVKLELQFLLPKPK